MPVPTSPSAAGGTPPVAAIVAAPLALMSALVPGFFVLVALGFSGGRLTAQEWLVLLLPAVFVLGLLVGAVLLLLGRSWLVLALASGGLAAVLLGGMLLGGWAEGALGFGLTTAVLPLATAVLAALPAVRRWVAVRRLERS